MNGLNPDDLAALQAEFADVKPLTDQTESASLTKEEVDAKALSARRKAAVTDKAHDENFLTTTVPTPVEPYAELAFKRDGVQTGVFKSLRQGQYEPQYVLDLHRHTVEQARVAVYDFILDAYKREERCVLILHGRGVKAPQPALLKSYLNEWLPQFEQVLAFHTAQKRDGGTGAVYVLLRKSQEASDENREIYSRR